MLAWYFLGARKEDIAIYSRLAHQISVADENFQKMSQALPRSLHILKIMTEDGGAWKWLSSTSAAIARHKQEPDIETGCGKQAEPNYGC